MTCRSVNCTNGAYADQEIRCGRLNLSTGAHDGWLVSQGEGGTELQDFLAFIPPNTGSGTCAILDSSGSPSLQVSDTSITLSKNTTIAAGSDITLDGMEALRPLLTRLLSLSQPTFSRTEHFAFYLLDNDLVTASNVIGQFTSAGNVQ